MGIRAKPDRQKAAERFENAFSTRELAIISQYVEKIFPSLPHRLVNNFEDTFVRLKNEVEEAFQNGCNLESWKYLKVQQAEKRIVERKKKITLANLEISISIGHQPAIVKYLRELSDPLPLELAHKLADYLDPKRLPIKVGPKPRTRSLPTADDRLMIRLYRYLCNNRKAAQWLFHEEKEAFHINEQSNLFDADRNFSPKWKYPQRERDRNKVRLPDRGQIKEYVCERHCIRTRRFDDIYSRSNQDVIKFYNLLCADKRFSGNDPKRFTCELYNIKPTDIDKILVAKE